MINQKKIMTAVILHNLESEQQLHVAMHIFLEDQHHNQAATLSYAYLAANFTIHITGKHTMSEIFK